MGQIGKLESRLQSLEKSCSSNTMALARIEACLHDLLVLSRVSGDGGGRGEGGGGEVGGGHQHPDGGHDRRVGIQTAVAGNGTSNESATVMRQMAEEVADELKGRRRRRKSTPDMTICTAGSAPAGSGIARTKSSESAEVSERRKRRQDKRDMDT